MTNPAPASKLRYLQRVARWSVQGVLIFFAVLITLVLVSAIASRSKPPLYRWHTHIPSSEFSAAKADPGFTFEQYRKLEDALFDELSAYMLNPKDLKGHSIFSRFVKGGPQDPANRPRNWNRSVELIPDAPKGGVLLLHGLSDSPYSMRGLAEALYAQGFHVLAMRMPGHGTVPAGLLEVTWKDWAAAVKIGAHHVQESVGEALPFYICGYSNGGALAVHYCLDAIERGERVPDRMFLCSPAIGITEFARVARWDGMFGFIPYFEKSRWLTIEPEYDPYKYNSFTNNAGAQSFNLSQIIQERFNAVEDLGRLDKMPPILTFQSVVDDTVLVESVILGLYNRLPANGSEVVFFDVNHTSRLDGFVSLDYSDKLQRLMERRDLAYTVTRLTNLATQTQAVQAQSRIPGQNDLIDEPLHMNWPMGVFSLAHVAIPFPENDPLYGDPNSANLPDSFLLHIGTLAPRGERHVLTIPESQLMRLRHNPFYKYIERRVTETIRPAAEGSPHSTPTSP